MEIRENVTLAPYTTFHIGGIADYFVCVSSEEGLREALSWARSRKLPVTVLGGGSNVVISDSGIRGLVIINKIEGSTERVEGNNVLVTVGAGVEFDTFIEQTVARNWWGLENLSAIPGSVGATPVQNVGAYGVEVRDLITEVTVIEKESGEKKVLTNTDCAFDYRDSFFKHEGKNLIVTTVTFRLSLVPTAKLEYLDLKKRFEGIVLPEQSAIRSAVIAIRKNKFPDWSVLGTAGSFFKNPIIKREEYESLKEKYPELPGYETESGVKIPLGYVLDRILTLRNYREGEVGTYEGQALVVVNYGNATANEINSFAEKIEKKVFDVVGIKIEREVSFL